MPLTLATPVEPVPASSVILLRDSPEGLEVFMARRHIKSDFAPDVFVFPGGKADPGDRAGGDHLAPFDQPRLKDRSSPPLSWTALYMAAIRELYEEVGVLLAVRLGEEVDAVRTAPLSSERLALHRGRVRASQLSMRKLAELECLVYTPQKLRLYSNWITPPLLRRRFDTFFFATEMPDGQEPALDDGRELTDLLWVSPQIALQRYEEGRFPLVFATERHLKSLASFASVDEVFAATRAPIATTCPRWINQDGEKVFFIPGDPGYEDAES